MTNEERIWVYNETISDLQKRLEQAEAKLAEARAWLDAILPAVHGSATSDFEQSNPVVRAVVDLRAERDAAWADRAQLADEALTREGQLIAARAEVERFTYPRAAVLAFARLMEDRLRANDHKSGWTAESRVWLMQRLREETNELEAAAYRPASVGAEAADVANFAMMLADNAGALAGGPR